MRWLILAAALICSQAQAQTLNTLGAGSAAKVAAAAYQGPGDVISGATAWISCARAYSAAFASGAGNICKIVDTATGATACVIKIKTNGFADLTTALCPDSAPAVSVTTWCTITNPAGCSINIAYDQSGNGNDFSQATLARMPLLNFSGAGSLPGMECASTGTICFLRTSASFTQAQPINLSTVYVRTGAFTTQQGFIGAGGGGSAQPYAGSASTANNSTLIVNNSACITVSAADSSYHSLNALANGGSSASALNIDGSDTVGSCATNGYADNVDIHRGSGTQSQGIVMESGFWWAGGAWNATDRGNISTNQHSATYGYNF